ncbi:MAG: T9SS type A sorting domain-containing protein [Candidatus Cloacimonadaceae bacterium]
MNKGFKHIVLSLLLMAGLVVGSYALPAMFTSSQTPESRNWRLLEQLTMIDSSGTWVNSELKHNYFNALSPDVVDSTAYSCFECGVGWHQSWSDHFSYNPSQEYITEIVSYLVVPDHTIPQTRSIYTYDDDNHLLTATLQTSGLDYRKNRDWFDLKQVCFTYDNGALNNIMIKDMSYPDYPPDWYKWEFQFDAAGRISVLSETISQDSLNWVNNYRTNFLYHGADTNNSASQIELLSRNFPHYLHYEKPLEIGLLAEKIREYWMYQYWRNETQDIYTYNYVYWLNAHQTNVNTMMGTWLYESLISYTYDTNGNCDTELHQYWCEDPTHWVDSSIVYNGWENTTANADEISPAPPAIAVSVYPNPFSDKLSLEVTSRSKTPVSLEIFNCKGQKVHSETILPNRRISLSEAVSDQAVKTSGIYFLKVQQENQSTTKKLLHLN